jgi:hypothetical protein
VSSFKRKKAWPFKAVSPGVNFVFAFLEMVYATQRRAMKTWNQQTTKSIRESVVGDEQLNLLGHGDVSLQFRPAVA